MVSTAIVYIFDWDVNPAAKQLGHRGATQFEVGGAALRQAPRCYERDRQGLEAGGKDKGWNGGILGSKSSCSAEADCWRIR